MFLINWNTKEIHNLDRLQDNCGVDETQLADLKEKNYEIIDGERYDQIIEEDESISLCDHCMGE